MDIFEEDVLQFFEVLNKHAVKYILVGGVAVNCHGFSRSTGDVDLWIDDSVENRKKLVAALLERNIEGAEAFLTYPLLAGFAEIMLDNGIYIDLMSDLQFIKQNRFEACYQLATTFKLNETIELRVIHVNALIEEKEKSARPKDKEDAEQLKKMHKK